MGTNTLLTKKESGEEFLQIQQLSVANYSIPRFSLGILQQGKQGKELLIDRLHDELIRMPAEQVQTTLADLKLLKGLHKNALLEDAKMLYLPSCGQKKSHEHIDPWTF